MLSEYLPSEQNTRPTRLVRKPANVATGSAPEAKISTASKRGGASRGRATKAGAGSLHNAGSAMQPLPGQQDLPVSNGRGQCTLSEMMNAMAVQPQASQQSVSPSPAPNKSMENEMEGGIQTDAPAVAEPVIQEVPKSQPGDYTKRLESDESGDSEDENDQLIFTPQSTSSLSFKTQPHIGVLRGAPRVSVTQPGCNPWSIPGHSNTSGSRR